MFMGLQKLMSYFTLCVNESWDNYNEDKKSEIKSFQGVRYPHTEEVAVLDPKNYKPVPKDGKTMGEIMIRSNTV